MRCDHTPGRKNKSALHFAAVQGRAEVLRVLINAKADPALPDGEGNTPLHIAADEGHARAAHVLLEMGANRRTANNFGRTPESNAQSKPTDSSKVCEGKAHI